MDTVSMITGSGSGIFTKAIAEEMTQLDKDLLLDVPATHSMDAENQETLAQRDDAIFKHGKARGKAETVTAFLNLLDLRCTDIRGLNRELSELWDEVHSLKNHIEEME